MVHWITRKMYAKNGPNSKDENGISQGPKLREKKINQLLNLSKTDGQSVWLMKCYMQSKGMSYQGDLTIQGGLWSGSRRFGIEASWLNIRESAG